MKLSTVLSILLQIHPKTDAPINLEMPNPLQ